MQECHRCCSDLNTQIYFVSHTPHIAGWLLTLLLKLLLVVQQISWDFCDAAYVLALAMQTLQGEGDGLLMMWKNRLNRLGRLKAYPWHSKAEL